MSLTLGWDSPDAAATATEAPSSMIEVGLMIIDMFGENGYINERLQTSSNVPGE
jgi:hypothetical protein